MGLGLLSTVASGVALLLILMGQIVAQRPAFQGVVVLYLSKRGEVRLWNQPIHPGDLPAVLDHARSQSHPASLLAVRLVPEREVPWGVVNRMLDRLRPVSPQDRWILQLQLP